MERNDEFSQYLFKGHRLIELEEVTSTNSFMEVLLGKGATEEGLVVKAAFQTEGKGMSGNSWESLKNMNLLMSLFHIPNKLDTKRQFYLSKCCANAISTVLNRLINEDVCRVKWPNDIYISDQKIAGTLIQSSLRGSIILNCFLGIGININQVNFSNKRATSLKNVTNKQHDTKEVLGLLLKELDNELENLRKDTLGIINQNYYSKLIGYQSWLNYKQGDSEFPGKILKVEDDGHLLLELKNGSKQHYAVKDISLDSTEPIDPPTY